MDEILKQINALREVTGVYVITPPVPLMERAVTYWNTHHGEIKALFKSHDVTPSTIEAVLRDYRSVLMGQFAFVTTPQEQHELLTKIKPYTAYFADKYVLYFVLLRQYQSNLTNLAKYVQEFRGATEENKIKFLNNVHYSLNDFISLSHYKDNGIFTVKDFADLQLQGVNEWFAMVEAWSDLAKYCAYSVIASLALNASEDEAGAIPAPPDENFNFTLTQAKEFVNIKIKEARDKVAEVAQEATRFLEAETQKEQEQAKQEVGAWDSNTNKPEYLRLHRTLLEMTSKGVNAKARDGADLLPIDLFFEDDKKITSYLIETAVDGVNNLLSTKNAKKHDGLLSFETNISEFAEACGYKDANNEEKQRFLHALMTLSGKYIAVNTNKGVRAINVFRVRWAELTGKNAGSFYVDVELPQQAPALVTKEEYKNLKRTKGQAQNRFKSQILTKGHKSEEDLLNEIFGYSERLEIAKYSNAEETKKAKDYIRKKKSGHKRILRKMFEQAQSDAVIKFKYDEKTNVYSWSRIKM